MDSGERLPPPTARTDSRRRRQNAIGALVREIGHGEDDGVTPALRTALERGWGTDLPDVLANYTNNAHQKIETLCHSHYPAFLLAPCRSQIP